MVKSMLSGVAGLRAHQQKMDVIGNNIANVNTWGYKTMSFNFMDSIYQASAPSTQGNNTQNGLGGRNASQVGCGSVMSSISTNFTKGSPSPSDNPLDCMIDGNGFFIVGTMKTTTGINMNEGSLLNSGLVLSRVGILRVDNNGFLVDDNRNYVYGRQAVYKNVRTNPATAIDLNDPSTYTVEFVGYKTVGGGISKAPDAAYELGPICIPSIPLNNTDAPANPAPQPPATDPYDAVGDMMEMQSYKIGEDGTLIGVQKNTDVPITIGQVALATAVNPNGLEKSQGYYYDIGENVGDVVANIPNGSNGGKIKGNWLEMANVDLAKEFSEMITTQRGYQANTRIITVTDAMLEELVNMKR